ncbi:hypothetical protein CEE57_02440 [Stenotrophomonas maltophilia]|nr:hypothetical protein CEE57_02440 [Stenotrophomonas maltophilia]
MNRLQLCADLIYFFRLKRQVKESNMLIHLQKCERLDIRQRLYDLENITHDLRSAFNRPKIVVRRL